MADKLRDEPTYERATIFICHFNVVFDVHVLTLNWLIVNQKLRKYVVRLLYFETMKTLE